MNKGFIINSLAKLHMVFAGFMFLPFIVAVIFREPLAYQLNFLIPALVIFIISFVLERKFKATSGFNTRDAMIMVALCWLGYSLLGAIPLMLYPFDFYSVFDSIFEMVSGFSTTGATIAYDVESLPNSIIFWRSFAQFVGGLGIIAFTVAILSRSTKKSTVIMKAESPGPSFGNIMPRTSTQSRILYIIYIVMTLITIFFLWLGDLDLFDSIIYGLGAAGTGGFASKADSIGYYNSHYTEIVLSIAMFAFSINFNLYFYMITKKTVNFFKSEEFRWYIGLMTVAIITITINTWGLYIRVSDQMMDVIFTVTSISSTTGYVTFNTNAWPTYSRLVLALLMYIGGMAGSTAGGIKISRFAIILKSSINQFRESINPNRITIVNFEGKKVEEKTAKAAMSYVILHFMIFIILIMIMSLDIGNFLESFIAVVTTFNGLGQFGDAQSFYMLSPLSKFVLSIAMLLGRLEIYPLLLLLTPSSYRKKRMGEI